MVYRDSIIFVRKTQKSPAITIIEVNSENDQRNNDKEKDNNGQRSINRICTRNQKQQEFKKTGYANEQQTIEQLRVKNVSIIMQNGTMQINLSEL